MAIGPERSPINKYFRENLKVTLYSPPSTPELACSICNPYNLLSCRGLIFLTQKPHEVSSCEGLHKVLQLRSALTIASTASLQQICLSRVLLLQAQINGSKR